MIVFDVGASDTKEFRDVFGNPEYTIYAFEPTPCVLKDILYPLAAQFNNLVVVPKAVDIVDGVRKYNLAPNHEVNSLYEFSDNLIFTWPGRNDCVKMGETQVECVRMDTFCRENGITQIDLFHCDTQGNDLNVLRSFGDMIRIIKKGHVEGCNHNPLYKNTDNSVDAICAFLLSKGFKIEAIKDNDPFVNEQNVYFYRDDND